MATMPAGGAVAALPSVADASSECGLAGVGCGSDAGGVSSVVAPPPGGEAAGEFSRPCPEAAESVGCPGSVCATSANPSVLVPAPWDSCATSPPDWCDPALLPVSLSPVKSMTTGGGVSSSLRRLALAALPAAVAPTAVL